MSVGQSITKICRDCNNPFTLTEKEEKWYHDRNLKAPERCKSCRDKRKFIRRKESQE